MIINLENSWIIHDNKAALYPNSYRSLEDAKVACNNVPDEQKKDLLDGAIIYHVVNGDVISQIDIMVMERKYSVCNYFSSVHIVHKKYPYITIALFNVCKSVISYEDLYDKIQDTTNELNNYIGFQELSGVERDKHTIHLHERLKELSAQLSETAHELEEHLAWD